MPRSHGARPLGSLWFHGALDACDAESARVEGVAMLGHASGFNWDEALLMAAPLAAVCVLLLVVRRRGAASADTSPQEKK